LDQEELLKRYNPITNYSQLEVRDDIPSWATDSEIIFISLSHGGKQLGEFLSRKQPGEVYGS